MKWPAIILSIFMMFLSCVTCADGAPQVNVHEQTVVKDMAGATDEKQAADLCSPLCVCSCCPGFSVQSTLLKISQPLFTCAIPAPVFKPATVSNPTFSIWQPPKL